MALKFSTSPDVSQLNADSVALFHHCTDVLQIPVFFDIYSLLKQQILGHGEASAPGLSAVAQAAASIIRIDFLYDNVLQVKKAVVLLLYNAFNDISKILSVTIYLLSFNFQMQHPQTSREESGEFVARTYLSGEFVWA